MRLWVGEEKGESKMTIGFWVPAAGGLGLIIAFLPR
jgi:hypothetical protein